MQGPTNITTPKMDTEDRLAHQEQAIESINRGLEELQERLDSMASRLLDLGASQEALELQTALLSREAEDEGPNMPNSAFGRGRSAVPIDTAERLQYQLDDLNRALANSTAQAVNRADAIESELQGLVTSLQRLESELSDLRDIARRPTPDEPVRELHRTPLPAAATEDDWRAMEDEVGTLKVAGSVVQDRLLRLEQRRAALQESMNGLSLQQVRSDQDIRQLEKQIRHLSFLVATVGLLVAGTLAWLLAH